MMKNGVAKKETKVRKRGGRGMKTGRRRRRKRKRRRRRKKRRKRQKRRKYLIKKTDNIWSAVTLPCSGYR